MIGYPRIVAHRCGGKLAPENRLDGLEAVARLGCRAVEFDVMLTADDVPILMHDETLDRTTRCSGRVAAHTLEEIRARDPGVPTLAEALDACRRLNLWTNIELKPSSGREEATGDIVGTWLAGHWDGHGVISSFSQKSALAARRHLPESAFAALFERLPDEWLAVCARLGAVAVHLDAALLDADALERLQAADWPWAAYTVNTVEAARHLFALGCAAIFTDRPDLWPAGKA